MTGGYESGQPDVARASGAGRPAGLVPGQAEPACPGQACQDLGSGAGLAAGIVPGTGLGAGIVDGTGLAGGVVAAGRGGVGRRPGRVVARGVRSGGSAG